VIDVLHGDFAVRLKKSDTESAHSSALALPKANILSVNREGPGFLHPLPAVVFCRGLGDGIDANLFFLSIDISKLRVMDSSSALHLPYRCNHEEFFAQQCKTGDYRTPFIYGIQFFCCLKHFVK